MRYTTVIDITENPAVWRSWSARNLYLFMSLKAGWHDEDRDILKTSIRTLAADSGLTVSATRCALTLLLKHKLLEKVDGGFRVLKWICLDPPTPRTKAIPEQKKAGKLVETMEQQINDYQSRVLAAVRACSKDELETWLTELEEHRSRRHQGVQIAANQANIDWLKNIIKLR